MRNGTKFGLALIALTWLAASTAVSAHFVGAAMHQNERTGFVAPILYRVSADI